MSRIQQIFICGLLLCLASQRASSQMLQEDHLTAQAAPRKAAKAGSMRGSLASGAIPKESPELCFQPGVGWRRVSTGKADGSDTPSCGLSSTIHGNKPATGNDLESVYAQHSSGKQAIDPRGDIAVMTSNHRPGTTSGGSTSMNPGTVASLPGNLPSNPASGAISGRRMTALSSIPSGGGYFSSATEADTSMDRLRSLRSHAYVSSIAVRRMLRNTSDLETRIKLRELESEQSSKSHVSPVSSKGPQARKGHHVGTADSSSLSDGHGRAAVFARALSSHSYP
jgi:hypothetical protein